MIARIYMGFASAGVVILTITAPWLLKLLTSAEFHDAWPIVGILSWQSVLYGFFMIVSAGIWKSEKTYLNMYLMVGASFVGLLLNWCFVPNYGAMGAAVATVITHLFWIITTMIVSEMLWKVQFPFFVLAVQISMSMLFVNWFLHYGFNTYFFTSLLFASAVIVLQLISSFDSSTRGKFKTFLKAV